MTQANKENIRRWVEALRSGKYQQARGLLHHIDTQQRHTYCCLGVACDISGLGAWQHTRDFLGGQRAYAAPGDLPRGSLLPTPVAEWLGVDDASPTVLSPHDYPEDGLYRDEQANVAELNDDAEWDFNKLADAIEYTYLSDDDGATDV